MLGKGMVCRKSLELSHHRENTGRAGEDGVKWESRSVSGQPSGA